MCSIVWIGSTPPPIGIREDTFPREEKLMKRFMVAAIPAAFLAGLLVAAYGFIFTLSGLRTAPAMAEEILLSEGSGADISEEDSTFYFQEHLYIKGDITFGDGWKVGLGGNLRVDGKITLGANAILVMDGFLLAKEMELHGDGHCILVDDFHMTTGQITYPSGSQPTVTGPFKGNGWEKEWEESGCGNQMDVAPRYSPSD